MQIVTFARTRPHVRSYGQYLSSAPRWMDRSLCPATPRRFTRSQLRSPRRDVSLTASATDTLPVYGVLAAALSLLGFAGWKVYLYLQLEYITAAMIGNHVPKGGARVLQIGGGTRQLYYYPSGTLQVTITQSSTSKGSALSRTAPLDSKGHLQGDSADLTTATESFNLGAVDDYDAIVLLNKFGSAYDKSAFLKNLVEVLKPAGKLIFIEKEEAILKLAEGEARFGEVQSDVALEGQDRHIVGVATRADRKQKTNKRTKTGFTSA